MLKSSFSKHPKTLYRHTEKSKEFSFGKRRRRFRLLSSPACTTVTPSCGSPRCRHPTSAAHPECIVLREKVWAERMRSFGPMGSMSDLLRSSLRKQVTEATVEAGWWDCDQKNLRALVFQMISNPKLEFEMESTEVSYHGSTTSVKYYEREVLRA